MKIITLAILLLVAIAVLAAVPPLIPVAVAIIVSKAEWRHKIKDFFHNPEPYIKDLIQPPDSANPPPDGRSRPIPPAHRAGYKPRNHSRREDDGIRQSTFQKSEYTSGDTDIEPWNMPKEKDPWE